MSRDENNNSFKLINLNFIKSILAAYLSQLKNSFSQLQSLTKFFLKSNHQKADVF